MAGAGAVFAKILFAYWLSAGVVASLALRKRYLSIIAGQSAVKQNALYFFASIYSSIKAHAALNVAKWSQESTNHLVISPPS